MSFLEESKVNLNFEGMFTAVNKGKKTTMGQTLEYRLPASLWTPSCLSSPIKQHLGASGEE